MDFGTFFEIFAFGLGRGSMFALMAVGLSLVYGVMKLVNTAHGEYATIGAYFFLLVSTLIHPLLGLIIAPILVFALGILTEKVLLNPMRNRLSVSRASKSEAETSFFTLTLGLGILIQSVATLVFGAEALLVPIQFPGSLVTPLFSMSIQRLMLIVITPIALLSLFLFLFKTKIGRGIRAVSQNPEAAQVLGVDIHKIYMITFALSTMLAALAGTLLTPILRVSPFFGFPLLMKAFIVLVLGGLENPLGSIAGGIILGTTEAFATFYLAAQWQDVVGMIIMVVVLIIRPKGLLSR